MGPANKSRDDGLILLGMEGVHFGNERIDVEFFGWPAIQTFLDRRPKSGQFRLVFGIFRLLIHRTSSVSPG